MKLASYILVFFLTISVNATELQFAIMGDAGRWNSHTKMLLSSMGAFSVKKLIMPGDNLYEGTYEQQWGPWKKAGFTFDVIALGNHNETYAKEIKFFGMPGEYFSKEYANGDVQFLVLNSDNINNVTKQMTWLETQLQNSHAQQIYLVYHHPTFNVASHKWTEKKNFQLKIRPLLKAYRDKITALIVGHDHIAALMHFDSLPVVISGCTQSPRNEAPINNVQDGVVVKTALHLDGEPFWVLQDVASSVFAADTAELFFIRGRDSKAVCRAVIKTGYPATHQCD